MRLLRECYVQRSGKASGRHGSGWLACSDGREVGRHRAMPREPTSRRRCGSRITSTAMSLQKWLDHHSVFASMLFTNLGRTEAGVGVRVLGWLLAPRVLPPLNPWLSTRLGHYLTCRQATLFDNTGKVQVL